MSATQRPPDPPEDRSCAAADGAPDGGTVRLPDPVRAPGWLARALAPVATDFDERVVRRAPDEDAADGPDGDWCAAAPAGLEVRTLECLAQAGALRFTGQLRTDPGAGAVELGALRGAELLVQRGALELGDGAHGPGTYLRLPRGADAGARGAPLPRLAPGSLAYLSIGQIEPTDGERRVIDTTDPGRWLDGPVEGIEVLPLHGHLTGNVMLVRWAGPAAFRPKLDPSGEELLVLEGTLHDATGNYPAGSWIRTPVPAWQSWAGSPGTLVCYKSGHFGASA